MSKTRQQDKRRPIAPWFTAYTVCAMAGAIYIEGRIPLQARFYIKTLMLSTAVFLIGMIMSWLYKKYTLAGASMRKIDKMTGEDFEQYLGILYKRKGYKVEYTPGTMDFGADLILTKGGRRIIVQAKRYRNAVGEAAIQQAVAAMGYYKADRCMVITNSEFTSAAKELAQKTDTVLINRELLGTGKMFI